MGINWSSVKSFEPSKDEGLFLVLLGGTGDGKTSAIGTKPGKTLLLYSSNRESHSPKYMQANASKETEIIPFDLSVDSNTGEKLDWDGQLEQLWEILGSVGHISNNFDNIAVDGLTTLEEIYTQAPSVLADCVNKKGEHDTWAMFRKTKEFFGDVFIALNAIHNEGVDVMMTCLGDYRVDDEGLTVFKPSLKGMGVVEVFLAQIPDRILVRKVGTERKFIFDVTAGKKNDTFMKDCSPRLCPLLDSSVPPQMSPDLKKVMMLKNKEVMYNPETGKVEKAGK